MNRYLLLIISTYYILCINAEEVIVGASRMDSYLPMIQSKKVGMVVNHTSMVNGVHLIDTFLSLGIKVTKIFTPEHGFYGIEDAGRRINYTGTYKSIPIISLYGKNYKPKQDDVVEFGCYDI